MQLRLARNKDGKSNNQLNKKMF